MQLHGGFDMNLLGPYAGPCSDVDDLLWISYRSEEKLVIKGEEEEMMAEHWSSQQEILYSYWFWDSWSVDLRDNLVLIGFLVVRTPVLTVPLDIISTRRT